MRNTFATFSEDAFQFSWQAQHFGDLHRHFAWQAQHFRRLMLWAFCESHCQGCVKWRQGCKLRGGRGIFCDVKKIDGSLARNIDFEVANFEVHKKTCRKTSLLKLQSVKTGGGLARNARFEAPTCLVSILWFASAVAVPIWGKLQNSLLFEGIKAGCNVVLHGRRGTSRHFHVFGNVSKVVLCDRRNTFARLSAD